MRKKPIQFPIFTARENSKQKNFKTEEKPMKQKIKSKKSFNLLKLINEDINRVRKSERQNLAHLQKINCKKNNKISTIEGKAKEFSVPNKKIHSISGFQAKSNRKFEPNTSKTNRQKVGQPIKNRKRIIGSIQERQSIANVKLSSQKVIVARNRKQFTKIDEQLLYDRRQNYLNSKFNDRVNRLNNITQQNRKIYERINSQRSHYSNTDLNKSYESNSRISQRLSMSKLSKRSRLSMSSQKSNANSRCSIASKASSKYSYKNCGNLKSKQGLRNKQNSKNNLIKIQSKNINDIKADQLQNFATLFLQKPSHELKIKPGLGKRSKSVYSKQNDQNVVAPSAQRISVKSSGKTAKAKGLLPSLIEISQKNQLVKPKTSVLRKTILTAIDQNAIRLTVNCLQKIVEQSPVTARFSNFRIQNRRM